MRIVLILLLFVTTSISYSDHRENIIYLPEIVIRPINYEQVLTDVFEQEGLSPVMINFLIAQARHESGDFTSKLFITSNNTFAMKHPTIRQTTSLGPYGKAEGVTNFAHYDSVEDSAKDMVLYLRARNFPSFKTVYGYVRYLKKKGYFEDGYKNYVRGVKRYV